MRVVIEGCALELCRGHLTQESVDAIVNAANSSLLGGGGVDGAIHRAGGPAILEACKAIRAARGPLPTGQAVITPGGQLRARHVIHTVGPVWQGGEAGEEELLRSCYRASLEVARAHGLRRISFPSISTGAYRYPVRQAARAAIETVSDDLAEHPAALELVRFVLFDQDTLETYLEALTKLRTIALTL